MLRNIWPGTVHDLCFEPKYEEFRPRTIWSLSNAFTSALKELDPIPKFKATAKLGEFLEARFSQSFGPNSGSGRPPLPSNRASPDLGICGVDQMAYQEARYARIALQDSAFALASERPRGRRSTTA